MGNTNKTVKEQSDVLKILISKDKQFENYYLNSHARSFQKSSISEEMDNDECMNCTCTMNSMNSNGKKKKIIMPNKVTCKNNFMHFD